MSEAVNEEPRKSLADRVKEALDRLPNLEEQLKKFRGMAKEK